jgi:hypothetical protein
MVNHEGQRPTDQESGLTSDFTDYTEKKRRKEKKSAAKDFRRL